MNKYKRNIDKLMYDNIGGYPQLTQEQKNKILNELDTFANDYELLEKALVVACKYCKESGKFINKSGEPMNEYSIKDLMIKEASERL